MTHESIKDEVIEESPAVITEDITPRDLMKFAKSILIVIAALFLIGGISAFFNA
jgi:hypothetical protein